MNKLQRVQNTAARLICKGAFPNTTLQSSAEFCSIVRYSPKASLFQLTCGTQWENYFDFRVIPFLQNTAVRRREQASSDLDSPN